jgi:hypothetical protein
MHHTQLAKAGTAAITLGILLAAAETITRPTNGAAVYDNTTPDTTHIQPGTYHWEATGRFTNQPAGTMTADGNLTTTSTHPYGTLRDQILSQNALAKTITHAPGTELVNFILTPA